MSNQSFVRAGGFAGILLAVTSLVSVTVYFTLVPADQAQPATNLTSYLNSLAQHPTGTLLFFGLYALIAFWATIGIGAVYYRVRGAGEAWAWFATLIGEIASVGTIVSGLYNVANLRFAAALVRDHHLDAAKLAVSAPVPANPLGTMTFGLTGVWFLIITLLLWRSDLPRLLALVGLVAVADLAVGFVASVAGASLIATYTALIAGAVGGPLFWAWVGILLVRDSAKTTG